MIDQVLVEYLGVFTSRIQAAKGGPAALADDDLQVVATDSCKRCMQGIDHRVEDVVVFEAVIRISELGFCVFEKTVIQRYVYGTSLAGVVGIDIDHEGRTAAPHHIAGPLDDR